MTNKKEKILTQDFSSMVEIKLISEAGKEEIVVEKPNYKVYIFRDAVAKCLTSDYTIKYIQVGKSNSMAGTPLADTALKDPFLPIGGPVTETFGIGYLDGSTLSYGIGFRGVNTTTTDSSTDTEAVFNFTWSSGSDPESGDTSTNFGEFGLFADSEAGGAPIMVARFIVSPTVLKTSAFALSCTWRYFIKWS